ncbi:MAG: SixA phosphatase family protein [Actinomycetota bacterium]
MVIAFVRHAHAGSRSAWTDDDKLRPLSVKGERQATALVNELRQVGVTALISSPYLRCVQTLQPLSEETGIAVTVDERLSEDTSFEVTLSLLEHAPDGAVLCSHGDVIPATVDALVRRGMFVDGPAALRKGAAYFLHRDGGTFTRADYLPPPDVS